MHNYICAIDESYLAVLNKKITVDGVPYRVKYMPCAFVNRIVERVNLIQNYDCDCYTPQSCADQPIAESPYDEIPDTREKVSPTDSYNKLLDFLAVCLLYKQDSMIQKAIRTAPKKKDGTLAIGRVQRLAHSDLAIHDKFYELRMVNDGPQILLLEIKNMPCTHTNLKQVSACPSCAEILQQNEEDLNALSSFDVFFRKQEAEKYPYGPNPNLKVGDSFIFGKKKTKWNVLKVEEDAAWIISDSISTLHSFTPHRDVYDLWRDCPLRNWLNTIYLRSEFSEDDRNLILGTRVSTPSYQETKTNAENDSFDKIFIPSVEEIEQFFPDMDKRAIGVSWWLRTTKVGTWKCYIVSETGAIAYKHGYQELGICPMMRVSLKGNPS